MVAISRLTIEMVAVQIIRACICYQQAGNQMVAVLTMRAYKWVLSSGW
jgi:hypothetical protein